MTDHTPPTSPETPDDDADLLASLYLDGEATPEERVRVERDASLRSRVRELEVVSQALQADVPIPAGQRERQIAAALELLPTPAATDVVVPIARRRTRPLPSWLGAAAATVLVVGGIGFMIANGSTGGDDESESATDTTVLERESSAALHTTDDAAEEASVADLGDAADDTADDAADGAEEDASALAAEEAEEADVAAAAEPSADTFESESDDADLDQALFTLPFPDDRRLVEVYVEELENQDVIIEPDPLETSACAPEATGFAGEREFAQLDGVVPVVIGDTPAELFLGRTDEGIAAFALDSDCGLLFD